MVFDFLGLSSPSASLPLAAIASHLMSPPSTEGDANVSTLEATTPVSDGHDGAASVLDRMGTNPELIQDKPGTLPLMLIHDGGGTALAYRLLGDIGRTILGIHCPGLREGKGIVSIRHAADQYAHFARQWLDQHSPRDSRLVIGGWSLGGIIAIALAAAHPDVVAGVVLLDPPPPETAAMKSDEAEQLIHSRIKRPSGGFSAIVGAQLKMNSRSFSVDADRVGGYRDLAANLRAPVYLVSATEPLNHQLAKGTSLLSPGSPSEWMLSPQRASLTEGAWSDLLGKLLVGTERIPGDHFTMFTFAHAESTTRAVQQAADTLEAIAV
jgi:pimeloyl-ACP methyl ester carboxylesterase